MSGDTPPFDSWWESRPINDRLMHLHHDRASYAEEGWDAGIAAERACLRELVKELRASLPQRPGKDEVWHLQDYLDDGQRKAFDSVLALLEP